MKHALILGVFLLTTSITDVRGQNARGEKHKRIPINVKVESEGNGKGRGMWTQTANDLSAVETKALQKLVETEIQKIDDVQLVNEDYADTIIGIAIVAAKLPNGSSQHWYVASSAIVVSEKQGTDFIDEFLTHDVIAQQDLPAIARSISFQFTSARMTAMLKTAK